MKSFRHRVLEIFEQYSQRTLRNARYLQRFMNDGFRLLTFDFRRYIWQNLLFHRDLHLVRYAGHRGEDPVSFMEDHQRCRTYSIRQNLSTFRYEPLRSRKSIQDIGTRFVEIVYMRAHTLIFNKVGAEIVAQHMLGDIIFGRTETTGREHDIDTTERLVKRLDDMLAVVMHRCDLVQLDPMLIQPLRHPRGISVHDLTDEQFVSYSNYLCAHCFFHSLAVNSNSSYHACPKRRIRGSLRN